MGVLRLMCRPSNWVAIASVLWCVVVCACTFALMFINPGTRQMIDKSYAGHWVVAYVWVVLPYVVLGTLSAVLAALRKMQFFSWWILGCAVITTVSSWPLNDLLFENGREANVAIEIGPLLTWMYLVVLLALGVIAWAVDLVLVRVVRAVRHRPK